MLQENLNDYFEELSDSLTSIIKSRHICVNLPINIIIDDSTCWSFIKNIVKVLNKSNISYSIIECNLKPNCELKEPFIDYTKYPFIYIRGEESDKPNFVDSLVSLGLTDEHQTLVNDIDGSLSNVYLNPFYLPSVVEATLNIIKYIETRPTEGGTNNSNLRGKSVVVFNDSPYVGMPLVTGLMRLKANVITINSSVLHGKVQSYIDQADYVIFGSGKLGIANEYQYNNNQYLIDLSQKDTKGLEYDEDKLAVVKGFYTSTMILSNYLNSLVDY